MAKWAAVYPVRRMCELQVTKSAYYQALPNRARVTDITYVWTVQGWLYLKEEWIGDQIDHTREAAIRDMQEYMKYYDSVRLHSTLGYQTSMEYENGLRRVSGLG